MRDNLLVLVVLGVLALQPQQVRAQSSAATDLLIDASMGEMLLGMGPCGWQSAPGTSAGVEVRNRGSWVVSAGLDLLLPDLIGTLFEGAACAGGQPVVQYDGEWGHLFGAGSTFVPIRLALGIGRAFPTVPLRPALGVAAGFIPMVTAFGTSEAEPREERTDFAWEPWFAGRLRLQPEWLPVGLRMEVGKHRLRTRIYAEHEDRLLSERHHWEWMLGAAVSIPIRR